MLDVATVTGLGHRKAPQQIQGDQRPNVGVVVPFRAEILDSPAEEAPQNPGLDHQGQVGHRQHRDLGDRRPGVPGAAALLLEAVLSLPGPRDDLQLCVDPGPGDFLGRGEVRPEDLQ